MVSCSTSPPIAIEYELISTRSPNQEFISHEKRFEIDGAIAARSFVQKNGGKSWQDKHRQQLVWDSIALHTTADIARYKEPEVALTSAGTFAELTGIEVSKTLFGDLITVNQTEWQNILDAFPRYEFGSYIRGVLVNLCVTKPETTYGNPVGDLGERYVANYSRVGHRIIDIFDQVLPVNDTWPN